MERKRVNSSKIRAVGYDPKPQVLEVELSDGKVIQYRGVSPEVIVCCRLIQSGSKARWRGRLMIWR